MEIKKSIRVILADDHHLVRRGIRRILEKSSSIYVVGEAGHGHGSTSSGSGIEAGRAPARH